jgi:lipid-A-disaccharide synthase
VVGLEEGAEGLRFGREERRPGGVVFPFALDRFVVWADFVSMGLLVRLGDVSGGGLWGEHAGAGYTPCIATGAKARVFLSAGEASGDHYGAQIIRRARLTLPGAEFSGLGGLEMEGAGLRRVVRAEDVAVMGITEILRHVPRIYGSYRRLVGSIREQRPDVAVLIDFPDVNFRLAKHLRRAGVPVLWFVSPQLWAWKRGRLRWVQERVDRMLVIFPFEESFYRARGVRAEFVGHPLAEAAEVELSSRAAYAAAEGLDASKVWIALLPGSRRKEVNAHLYTMLQAAIQLGAEEGYEFLLPVASTLDAGWMEEQIRRWVLRRKHFGGKPLPPVRLVPDARGALGHARASVVASGTATVLAAVSGNPFVVVYRVSALTFGLAKRLVRYPAEIPAEVDAAGNLPVAMVNLVAGRRLIPELLNERFTPEGVVAALRPLLADGPAREEQVLGLAEVRRRLEPVSPGGGGIDRVVAAMVDLLRRRVVA